jgi:glycosyltransferase involved in cell wall biosynthesis
MTSPRRKILFLPKWYPDRKEDQNGNFIKQHARAVSQYADVIVLFANYDDFEGPNLIQFDFRKDNGIPTLYFYYKQRISGLNFIDKPLKLLLYFSCLMRGYRMVLRLFGRPDLLHVHVLLRTGLFAWFKCLTDGLPYLITEHWTLYLPENAGKISWLRGWLSGLVIKKAAAVHTVSKDLQRVMESLGFRNRKFAVISNVVDTDLFRPLPQQKTPDQKVRFLHVSVLNDRAKNISGLLKAFHRISALRNDFELHIIGFGPSEDTLKKLAADLDLLNKQVYFQGKKEADEVAAFLQRSNVFVLPSFYETFGVVLIEALACGVPVIATSVGGVPEVFGPEQGILIPPGNDEELYQAILFMMDNHSNFNYEALREFAVNRYGFAAVGQQFAALYESVLS